MKEKEGGNTINQGDAAVLVRAASLSLMLCVCDVSICSLVQPKGPWKRRTNIGDKTQLFLYTTVHIWLQHFYCCRYYNLKISQFQHPAASDPLSLTLVLTSSPISISVISLHLTSAYHFSHQHCGSHPHTFKLVMCPYGCTYCKSQRKRKRRNGKACDFVGLIPLQRCSHI